MASKKESKKTGKKPKATDRSRGKDIRASRSR